MTDIERIKDNLKSVVKIKGVENALLTQRDGNPITSEGAWFSEKDVFNVVSATSAIYNGAIKIHDVYLEHLVIEGPRMKILITPINQEVAGRTGKQPGHEYYVAVTSMSKVNLGHMLLQMYATLSAICKILADSGNETLPPLREFDDKQKEEIKRGFQTKEETTEEHAVSSPDYLITKELITQCNLHMARLTSMLPDIVYMAISLSSGSLVTNMKIGDQFNLSPEDESAFTNPIVLTSMDAARTLKKTTVNSIQMDCGHYYHFILPFEGGILSTFIAKGGKRASLGNIRLQLSKITPLLQDSIKNAKFDGNLETFNIM